MARQARILLVDDRPENLVALDAILAPLNQVLVPVQSGEQAVQAVLADEYALVLLDIMMPGMDGFETARQIKQHTQSRDVPIIFLTAATMEPEQAFRGYAAGAVDYLAKPFDPWVLKAKVSVFVDLYLKRAEAGLDYLSAGLGAVEEALRMFPAFAHFRRTATCDTELHGQQIKEGEKVVMWYVSSNRDESRYEEPDRFDIHRNPEHQAFGAGGRHPDGDRAAQGVGDQVDRAPPSGCRATAFDQRGDRLRGRGDRVPAVGPGRGVTEAGQV